MMHTMIEARPRLNSTEVGELIDASGYPADIRDAKTEKILTEYRDNPDQPILCLESGGDLVGLIALRRTGPRDAVTRHIVVRQECRGRSLGRELILRAQRMLGRVRFTAETDRDAAEFYQRLWFAIRSLGENYPGVERFECTLEAADLDAGSDH